MSWDKTLVNLSDFTADEKKNGPVKTRVITYKEAVREALYQALREDDRVFLFGEGIDDPSGTFGTTLDLHKKFGPGRVFDTPICENTLTGIAIGASLAGLRPVLIHVRIDFMLLSMDQLINHAAKWKYMFGGNVSVPIVIIAIIGGGWGSAAQHSQAFQALFTHIPGLKVVMPSNAYDAKGLLLSGISDDSPVIFIQHRWLHDHKGTVPVKKYFIPLGKSALIKKGSDITIIASSFMVKMAEEAAKRMEKDRISAEIIDLRTVKPLDYGSILNSVKKTHRAAILDFGYKFCGISSEVSSFLAENAFPYLKAPVARITLPDCPTPCSHALEKIYYPNVDQIVSKIKNLFA